MNEIIRKRKSIRKYDFSPLDDDTLKIINEKIGSLKPLYPDIRFSVEIVNKTKGLFNVKAPYYLIFGSEEKDGSNENIGYIGQQMSLFFTETGLGSCWLGAARPGDKDPEDKEESALPFVICMAFGKPGEPLHRDISEFKRKTLREISDGTDERLEAARLAPSAMNAQNWYFTAMDGKLHCYRKKANPLVGFIYNKMHCVDMGIALCHIAEESGDFHFSKETGLPERKGYVYTGTVSGAVNSQHV